MNLFWFRWKAFWYGFFHPFNTKHQQIEYAQKAADKYFGRLNKDDQT